MPSPQGPGTLCGTLVVTPGAAALKPAQTPGAGPRLLAPLWAPLLLGQPPHSRPVCLEVGPGEARASPGHPGTVVTLELCQSSAGCWVSGRSESRGRTESTWREDRRCWGPAIGRDRPTDSLQPRQGGWWPSLRADWAFPFPSPESDRSFSTPPPRWKDSRPRSAPHRQSPVASPPAPVKWGGVRYHGRCAVLLVL